MPSTKTKKTVKINLADLRKRAVARDRAKTTYDAAVRDIQDMVVAHSEHSTAELADAAKLSVQTVRNLRASLRR